MSFNCTLPEAMVVMNSLSSQPPDTSLLITKDLRIIQRRSWIKKIFLCCFSQQYYDQFDPSISKLYVENNLRTVLATDHSSTSLEKCKNACGFFNEIIFSTFNELPNMYKEITTQEELPINFEAIKSIYVPSSAMPFNKSEPNAIVTDQVKKPMSREGFFAPPYTQNQVLTTPRKRKDWQKIVGSREQPERKSRTESPRYKC